MLIQIPRFTNSLRDPFDVDQYYLHRKTILHNQKPRNSASSLDESELARKIVQGWEEASSEVRQAYKQFTGAVVDMVDGEMRSEEFHEVALAVFELQKLIGHTLADAKLRQVASLAQRLLNLQPLNKMSAISIERNLDADDDLEFGADLFFQAPARFLVDVSLDDGDMMDFESTVPLEFHNEQYGHTSPADHSIVDGEKFNLAWIRDACDKIVRNCDSQLSQDELAMAICRVLNSEKPGEEIAGDLLDLVGDSAFETVQIFLLHRKEIVESIHHGLLVLKSDKNASNAQSRMPSYGTQVTVQTESGKQIDKLRRKEEKRNRRVIEHAGDGDLSVLDFSSLLQASERKNLFDEMIGSGDRSESIAVTALPEGTVRKHFKGYEEVIIPPKPTAPLKPGEKLIEIRELDDFAQAAFRGYKSLNRIQSRIFSTVYGTNENILVCAPTGAGKTNIAMISILHEIGQHFRDGYLHKDEFKIVYVAPMKALAAEVTSTFSQRLSPLNMIVRELTGDMQLSKNELEETQMIVTTPEKWDVITRKSSDMSLSMLVKLLIIDEVHLLNDDRGPVIEALVARTLRQVESTQTMIRIVGLSATLPNYLEVAQFLRVNPDTGLFFFDSSYRPVPLAQQYIGISEPNFAARNELLNDICYRKVADSLRQGHQAMVFVHSRKDTVKTANKLVELARRNEDLELFSNNTHPQYTFMKKEVIKSRNKDLVELFEYGVGVHHAGMLRADRGLTERLFSDGLLKVLVCTATLAWGVNLPAHTVVIKKEDVVNRKDEMRDDYSWMVSTEEGTQLYDPKAGGWRDLGMLDVMQIFGRAGRPQFDKSGEGIIITSHDKLAYYLRLLTSQLPIESQFISSLKDNLNAEVALGTVTNVKEACAWLGYTYLFIRMKMNPLAYGIGWDEVMADPALSSKQRSLVIDAARALDKAKMMRFDEKSGNFYCTELGRIASHFYIQYSSVETYNEMLRRHMNDSEVINMIAHSSEFENIAVREEEQNELEMLARTSCPLEIKGGPSNKHGKISILIQLYISRGSMDSFSLVSDAAYISASLARITRALFEICLRRGWCEMTLFMLEYSKAVDRQVWPHQHPLRQFDKDLSAEILRKLEERGADLDRLFEMEEKDIGALIRYAPGGRLVKQNLGYFPSLQLSATVSPITRTVLKVDLVITPIFTWKDRFHGTAQRWWILVEDSENDHIYHSELLTLTKRMARGEPYKLSFTVPIFEPHPPQYYIHAVSDSWLHAESFYTITFHNLPLPEARTSHTELLDLKPLPVSSLGNNAYEGLYKFSHFNPIQTQSFHTLYHTDNNVLLGAPTGSGKTISAELAMLRLFNTQPDMKVIYIAPLKAIVRERMSDWQKRLVSQLRKKMVEMTGDYTPDLMALLSADIIISTPEKWDGISQPHLQVENVRDEVGSFGLLNRAFVPVTEKITEPAIKPLELEARSALEPAELAAGPAPKPVSNESGKFRKNLLPCGAQVLQFASETVCTTPRAEVSFLPSLPFTAVGLMILDEIHLLGADRGPILEVIVSRMRYISSQTERPVRFIGLSTALANAGDLADWLGVEEIGLFNFKPSVRPVPLEVHIQGYPGKYYCPRMNSMNKPAYAAICTHSPAKPVLIFVSSRRQTRLTALDLIQFAASDEQSRQFLNLPEETLQMVLSQVSDQNLRHTLQFGIGLHHAGLNDKDRSLVEELFGNNKIQILVCTSTLAWGVNLPAHLVIIKCYRKSIMAEPWWKSVPVVMGVCMVAHQGRFFASRFTGVELGWQKSGTKHLNLSWCLSSTFYFNNTLHLLQGTEYYDGKAKRYVDFPITDILQMMGRAGRPQFDQHGKAVILVHEPKKSFYKKFLYEPFPVESSLREHLHNHINAEIISGTICHKQDAVHYLTWTYLFRRLVSRADQYFFNKCDYVTTMASDCDPGNDKRLQRRHESKGNVQARPSEGDGECKEDEVALLRLVQKKRGNKSITMRDAIMRGVVVRVVATGVVAGRGATMTDISTYRCYYSSYDLGRFGGI
ncbi:hypothetical protein V8G54_007595, partial [Vigna mungo]